MAQQQDDREQLLAQLEQDKANEEKRIEKENDIRLKEKAKREKAKLKNLKKLEKKETKKIWRKIKLPYKILTRFSLLFGLFIFSFLFFYLDITIYKSLIYSFWLFTALWFGGGLIMIAIYWMISIDKEQKLKEETKKLLLAKEEEERKKQEAELRELEQIEREVTKERFYDLPRAKALPSGEENQNMLNGQKLIIADELGGMDGSMPLTSIGGELPQELPQINNQSLKDSIDLLDLDILNESNESKTSNLLDTSDEFDFDFVEADINKIGDVSINTIKGRKK